MSSLKEIDDLHTPSMAESMTNGHSTNGHVNGIDGGTNDHTTGETRGFTKSFDEASYEPIAIIGCGMRLPGSVDNDEDLWQLLSGKQDGCCRVPLDRYNVDAFYGPGKAGHVCTEFG